MFVLLSFLWLSLLQLTHLKLGSVTDCLRLNHSVKRERESVEWMKQTD